MNTFNNVIFGQKALIINDAGKILIIKRDKELIYIEKWDVPGGKLDNDETLIEALTREIKEEVGLELHKIICTLTSSKFEGKLSGNLTIYRNIYLCRADGEIKLSSEHSEYKWVSPGDLTNFEFGEDDDLSYVLKSLPQILSTVDINISYSKLI
ncbi:NUDIX domain-containing protein [Candidatus Dojkabacteria bacterium]|uniref:8-oxo-dGTP diphosphatase n=1 Tax=Candidatus Dojkabacteria bacterium TaxID=2099670 RepID=A0A955IAN6_9BACT|nr:NUDIX domain-containing protein [Candidatus Dojkabacteria bacterium]